MNRSAPDTARAKDTVVPTIGVPAAPPLPDDLEAVLRRLWLHTSALTHPR